LSPSVATTVAAPLPPGIVEEHRDEHDRQQCDPDEEKGASPCERPVVPRLDGFDEAAIYAYEENARGNRDPGGHEEPVEEARFTAEFADLSARGSERFSALVIAA
jgi:hypothetical protein